MKLRTLLILSAWSLLGVAFANDAEAQRLYDAGYQLYRDGKYYDAGKKFEDAELEADEPLIRSNSLLAQIGAWRMCEMPYREFTAIEKLLQLYPEYADFANLTRREYEIAELYYQGKREPAFWHLRWIPWLDNGDKSMEIYTKALERAPFSEWAPAARLRLAYLLDQDGKKRESVAQLEKFVADYPSSDLYRYALLSLANGYLNLSERGDGDGRFITQAYERLLEFQKKFPEAPENEWVQRMILAYRDAQAKRLYEMAKFYEKQGRQDAAERYLAKVLIEYPDSVSAPDSEKMLVELDDTFIPADVSASTAERLPKLKSYQTPTEASRVLLMPGQNNNHYLIAVPDLTGEVNQTAK